MVPHLISFGSDNHSGIHPEILNAIAQANVGHAPSYGTDHWSEQCAEVFRKTFGPQAETFLVFNGTAANVLSLRLMGDQTNAVFCTDVSHMNVDECGSPEILAQKKLITVKSDHGKMNFADLQSMWIRRGDQHYAQPTILSLTQPTELGTCYSVDELKKFSAWCKEHRVLLHIDGARLASAAAYLKKSFQEITTDIGADIVSFGGTKNGLMAGEAVVILNPKLAATAKFHRKQLLQLPSKSRFLAAQLKCYLETGLWKTIADHAISQAQLLARSVSEIPGVRLRCSPESNAVFAFIPKTWVKPLREKFFFYVWDEHTTEVRWMTSWDTTPEHIQQFANSLKELSHEIPSRSIS